MRLTSILHDKINIVYEIFSFISLSNRRRKKESHILLRQHFNKVQKVYTPGNLEKFLIGLATQPGQDFDNYFSKEVNTSTFEFLKSKLIYDLILLSLC